MLTALPRDVAAKYSVSRDVFRDEAELPRQFASLCQRYFRMRGNRQEWIAYLHRPVAPDLWNLAPEEDTVATVSVSRVHFVEK